MRTAVAALSAGMLVACSSAPGAPQDGQDTAAEVATPRTWEDELAALGEMYGIADPPVVEPVREITPAESKEVFDACLVERGWTMNNGGFTFLQPQREALNLDSYICKASYPIRAEYLTPLDDAGWARIYEYWVDTTVPCLRAEGLDVPDPPTRETFLQNRAWTPDGPSVRGQVDALVVQGQYPNHEHVFMEVCPVSPPAEVRLGS